MLIPRLQARDLDLVDLGQDPGCKAPPPCYPESERNPRGCFRVKGSRRVVLGGGKPSWVLACLEGQTHPKIAGFRGRHSAEEAAGAKGQGRTGSLRKVQEVYRDWRVWNVRLVSGSLWLDTLWLVVRGCPAACSVRFRGNLPTGAALHCEKFAS